jgi:hypothetical protein
MAELLLARSAINQALYQLRNWQNASAGCLFIEFSNLDAIGLLVEQLEKIDRQIGEVEDAINS